MRILMFSWEYPPNLTGGLGAHVSELVPALAEQGIDLTLITPRWKGGAHCEQLSENAVVYRVDPPVERLANFNADVQQTNIVLEAMGDRVWKERGGFDLIHAHDWLVSFAAESLKKIYKTPLIATMHATERGRGRGQLDSSMALAINGAEWWLTFEAWRVITTSRFMAHEVQSYFELPADKIVVIPNGVNPARFDDFSPQELEAFRREWAAPDEPIVFYVGRLQYEKGVHLLVEAAHRIHARGISAQFILAGTGAIIDSLRERVAALGIRDHFSIPGYVSDRARDQLFRVANVAVFPSLYEPFGIVALEAMAAHCPVIVSDVGGLGEVVDDGLTGIKIPPDNLDALVNAILDVLGNPAVAEERAGRAYVVVCHEFGWNHIARKTIDLYAEIIEARKHVDW